MKLQREYREELERTAPLSTRIKMLSDDASQVENAVRKLKLAGDHNGELAAQIELLKKRDELDRAKEQLAKQTKPEKLANKEMSHFDSLSGMGLMSSLGSMTNPLLDVSREQLTELQAIKAAVSAPSPDIYAP